MFIYNSFMFIIFTYLLTLQCSLYSIRDTCYFLEYSSFRLFFTYKLAVQLYRPSHDMNYDQILDNKIQRVTI